MSLPRARVVLGLVVALCGGGVARADDPETLVARRHYERGVELYEAQRYDEACEELETARRVLSVPALDYNVAKCQERRQRWGLAIEAYERFLAHAGVDPAVPEVIDRVAALRARLARPLADEEVGRRRRLRIAGISLGVGAAVLAGVATGAYLSAWGDYQAQRRTCSAQPCAAPEYEDLTRRVRAAQGAGYALWAVSGALLAADVGVWIGYALSKRRAPAAWIAPTGAGATVGGTF